jgi:hypothetical protein
MSIKNIFGFLKETGTQEEFKVPKSAQQSIPIKTLYKDGIMRVGNRFSKTLKFTDINYSVASDEDKEDFFRRYSSVLNSLTTEAITKITINNRKLNLKDFKSNMLLRHEQDSADVYRDEINGILLDKMADSIILFRKVYHYFNDSKEYSGSEGVFCKGMYRPKKQHGTVILTASGTVHKGKA